MAHKLLTTRKLLKPLSKEARDAVNAAMAILAREGHAIWGFVFASQPASERLQADAQDFVQFEVFNNAGEDSIPAVITKTEAALVTLRTQLPLGAKIEDEFTRVLGEVNRHRPEGDKITFETHKMDS
jgi:hypothetical protein